MIQFQCRCGQRVFFDSIRCVACGAVLGFCPERMAMLAFDESADGQLRDPTGHPYRMCANGPKHGVCNWLCATASDHPLCPSCQFNRTIPNLGLAVNVRRWHRFEIAKKRLFFTLLRLELPLSNGFEDPEKGLLLDFIEDHRSNPEHYPESFVHTGFNGGVITINAMEADDAMRESIRAEMNEPYRTLLGHLRHESGHYYYWSLLAAGCLTKDRFDSIFGDSSQDYQGSLTAYYASGPQIDWQAAFISAYASAHPLEDWAETWGHFLLIYDSLETAACCGLIERAPRDMDMAQRVTAWTELSVTLNELNRSSGLGDTYPFVVNSVVARKLGFVAEVIAQFTKRASVRR